MWEVWKARRAGGRFIKGVCHCGSLGPQPREGGGTPQACPRRAQARKLGSLSSYLHPRLWAVPSGPCHLPCAPRPEPTPGVTETLRRARQVQEAGHRTQAACPDTARSSGPSRSGRGRGQGHTEGPTLLQTLVGPQLGTEAGPSMPSPSVLLGRAAVAAWLSQPSLVAPRQGCCEDEVRGHMRAQQTGPARHRRWTNGRMSSPCSPGCPRLWPLSLGFPQSTSQPPFKSAHGWLKWVSSAHPLAMLIGQGQACDLI